MMAAPTWYEERAAIQARLEATGERHVILVRYGPKHDGGEEWVANGADIDAQPVVWAREMDEPSNRRLRRTTEDDASGGSNQTRRRCGFARINDRFSRSVG